MPRAHPRRSAVRWLRLLALALCLGLFAYALARSDLGAAVVRVRAIGPLALLVLLPFPVAMLADAAAWRRLLVGLGRQVRLRTLFAARLALEAVINSAPGGAVWAEAVGPVLVSRRTGVPVTDVIAASTAKRWLLIRSHGAYVAVATALAADALMRASVALVGTEALVLVVLAGALALVLLSVGIETLAARARVAARLSRALGKLRLARLARWVEDRHHHFENADAQLARLAGDPKTTAAASVRIAMLWIAEGFETFLILRLLGANLGLLEVMSFDAALSVVRSAVVFAPAGIGVQDVGYLAVLEAYGVPASSGIGPAFVVVKRAKEAAWVLVGFALLGRAGPRSGLDVPGAVQPPQPPSAAT